MGTALYSNFFVLTEATKVFVSDHQKMMSNLSYYLTYTIGQTSASSWVSSTPLLVSLLASLLGVFIVFRTYKYDPLPQDINEVCQPIGGWLILVAIGLTLTPFRLLYQMGDSDVYFNAITWTSIWELKKYGLFVFLIIELIYNLVYIFFSVLLVVLFYQRRSSVPVLIMFYYSITCMLAWLDLWIANYGLGEDASWAYDDVKDAVRSVITALIWIPYFKLSDRVKSTFVNRLDRESA